MLLRCESLEPPMSLPGQERRISAVRNISGLPPRADVGSDIVERLLCVPLAVVSNRSEAAIIRSPRRRALYRQLDVLVEAEEVGRIILVLQGNQLRILRRTIGGLHPLYSLVRLLPQIVDVHPIGRERLHRLPELATPTDARQGLRRVRACPGAAA